MEVNGDFKIKVAVIGNGPSWKLYDGWGDAVVGCAMGAPIQRKYNFTVAGYFKTLSEHVIEDYWDIPPKAPQYLAPHILYQFKKLPIETQAKIIDRINVVIDVELLKGFPQPFQLDTKRIVRDKITNGKAYMGERNKSFKSLTTGHWAIVYALQFFRPVHIKCWGFDAHLDYKTKCDTLSLEYAYKPGELSKKFSEEHLLLAKSWPITFSFIQSVYPNCKIEIA